MASKVGWRYYIQPWTSSNLAKNRFEKTNNKTVGLEEVEKRQGEISGMQEAASHVVLARRN
jgi:hypothetical protein